MEILPVNDLDVALQNFVNKDDKLAFYNCVQYNLEETRVSILWSAEFQLKQYELNAKWLRGTPKKIWVESIRKGLAFTD